MIIGLTGPTGAGKSEASNYLKSKGFVIIDADKLVHNMYI
ncbi:MAG: dephospho-CoA kinase, partial [Oscillospiraceae bacterium]|nr:dephospho-CoA kinase [Oscillospiraceae bacterium]